MSNSKKKRLSMLDNLASAGAPAPQASMLSSNRALKAARDAVDNHHVWELDPRDIEDSRISDRLDPGDVQDLMAAIEANGQTVPILVRRHPDAPDRYLLVYGRRRLEAIRYSDKVEKIRALVANLSDQEATRAQISENMARRDLSFIEKALFARELIDQGFGNQSQVAEVLTVTKSAISMALAVVETVTPDLATAIGPAHGVGRPRWEALAKAITETGADPVMLIRKAEATQNEIAVARVKSDNPGALPDPSQAAFEAVLAAAAPAAHKPKAPGVAAISDRRALQLAGKRAGSITRNAKGLTLEITDGPFADWLNTEADKVLQELHARWKNRAED